MVSSSTRVFVLPASLYLPPESAGLLPKGERGKGDCSAGKVLPNSTYLWSWMRPSDESGPEQAAQGQDWRQGYDVGPRRSQETGLKTITAAK